MPTVAAFQLQYCHYELPRGGSGGLKEAPPVAGAAMLPGLRTVGMRAGNGGGAAASCGTAARCVGGALLRGITRGGGASRCGAVTHNETEGRQ